VSDGTDDGAGNPGKAPVRVVVADDQAVIRTGLRMILDNEPDVRVVAEAADGLQAVAAATAARPDVVLMDIRMPLLDGIEATRRIVHGDATGPGVGRSGPAGPGQADVPPRVLVLTTFDDDEYVFGALRAGASGFLLKDVGPDPLIQAIHTVARHEGLIAPTLTRRLVERYVELERRSDPGRASSTASTSAAALERAQLTEREHEVLVGLATGLSNGELAGRLYVSEATVKSHVSSLLAKLGLRSRVQAVVVAYEAGLVRPGDDRPLDLWPTGPAPDTTQP
jgi:DNA-binding NarL/FixJ family response regulator